MVPTTTIQVNTAERLHIKAKTDRTLSETGQVIKLETLRGFSLICAAIAVVVVEIHGAGTKGSLAVFDETRGTCLLRQYPKGHSHGQGGLIHC